MKMKELDKVDSKMEAIVDEVNAVLALENRLLREEVKALNERLQMYYNLFDPDTAKGVIRSDQRLPAEP